MTPGRHAPSLRDERGTALLAAMIGIALLAVLVAAVSSLSSGTVSARKRQEVQEVGATVEDAAVLALGDAFRHVPLATALNCNNLPALFSNVVFDSGGKLTVTSAIPPAPGPTADRADFAAAKARCHAPRIPAATAAGAPLYLCAVFPTTTGPASPSVGSSFLRSDQAFVEFKMSFLSLSDRKPLSCAQLRQYALGAGAEISYRIYWRNHALAKDQAVFNTLTRTVVLDLTPGP